MFKKIFILGLLAVTNFSCDPNIDDKEELGTPPTSADFTISQDPNAPNTFILTNETPGAFIYQWDLGNGIKKNGESVSAFYQKKGEYTVTLTIANDGGYATGSKTISVTDDAPLDCENNEILKFLSNCSSKSWKLNPAKGALWVGPADLSQTWWQNELAEIGVRPCAWNDVWTFTDDLTMVYDTKGDLWAEDYMGFSFECIDENLLAETFKPWASGTHNYSIDLDATPPTLTVSGLGAFIGLPKAANGDEMKAPVSSVTYTINQYTQLNGVDFLEISVNFGPGIWRFQLVAE